MCRINKVNVIVVLILCTSYNWAKELTEIDVLSSSPNHCTYEYAFEMYGAHCAGLRLSKVPNLRGSIEILDFSDNKLQELDGETFSSYTSIKFLYLADNQIYQIEEDALSLLTSLETLDLSNNVILTLPNSMFQLPSLRNLYLRGNPLLHINTKEFSLHIPIKAPLSRMDISNCKIKELPDWGNLPYLDFYNISHIPLTKLDAIHFPGMCNLAKVDLTESLDKLKLCDIKPVVAWFESKRINWQLSDYTRLNTGEFSSCPVVSETLEVYNATYNQCKSEYLYVQNIRASRRTWLTIGGGLAGFLVGFILLLYITHRVNVAQTKTTAEKIQQEKATRVGDKDSSAVLLNNVS